MSKLNIGPHTDLPHAGEDEQRFDREINLRAVFWTVVGLAAIVIVSQVLMWYLLEGIGHFEKRADPPPLPLAAANTQPPPPEPRLQTRPEVELQAMRDEENQKLRQSSWVDQAQGTVRVPIDVAMDVIASRGLGPEVVGGQSGSNAAVNPAANPAANPATVPPEPPAAGTTSSQR